MSLVDTVWASVRAFVPIQIYPLLGPIRRYRQRNRNRQIAEDDQRYLATHTVVVPPVQLRVNVGVLTISEFFEGGQRIADNIERTLGRVKPLAQCTDFLDFGCGCGRVSSALSERFPSLSITGCDVDEQAIRWCQEHLPGNYVVNDAMPPAPWHEESFDVIWCGSVFTHLDEDRQDAWLSELSRLLRPGGIMLASVHGPHLWESRLPLWTRRTLTAKGFLFRVTGADSGIHPDWYQVAYHTQAYVESHWARFFKILDYVPQGVENYQDLVIAVRETRENSRP
jgi:SAM-dependent methyltransferase